MDRDLVERAQAGDETAFASIAMSIGDRLHATAQHILHDSPRADDAAQDAMVEMWRRLPTLREADSFEAWAYRILVRGAFAEARRRSRWSPLALLERALRTTEPDPADRIADRDQLDRALDGLPLGHRAVVVLKYFADLSNAQIAEAVGIPEGTVRSRLHYAIAAMRATLEADARPSLGAVTP